MQPVNSKLAAKNKGKKNLKDKFYCPIVLYYILFYSC